MDHGLELRAIPGCIGYLACEDGTIWSKWKQVGRGRGNWRHVDFPTPNHASGAKKKKIMTERLWMNYGENGERL